LNVQDEVITVVWCSLLRTSVSKAFGIGITGTAELPVGGCRLRANSFLAHHEPLEGYDRADANSDPGHLYSEIKPHYEVVRFDVKPGWPYVPRFPVLKQIVNTVREIL
jgi:hypothetical protein